MSKIVINYSAARCGAGKTEFIARECATRKTQHIVALPRRDMVAQVAARIGAIAANLDLPPPVIVPLILQEGIETVRRAFEVAIMEHESTQHLVFIVTHAGLRQSIDHAKLTGWTLWVDEALAVRDHIEHRTPASYAHLAAHYTLEPFGDGHSRIVSNGRATVTAYLQDDHLQGLATLHRRVTSPFPVYCDITDWEQVIDGTKWWSASMWNAEELLPYSAIYMLANDITATTTYELLNEFYGDLIEWQPFDIPDQREWTPGRKVTLNYFVDRHEARRVAFTSDAGRTALDRIERHLRGIVEADAHYWVANKHMRVVLPGIRVSSKVAGSNAYRDKTEFTILYSAKPSPVEIKMNAAHGISPELVTREREHEDIIQVVMRSSLRLPEDRRPVTGYVYSRDQAELIADYLTRNHYGCDITINHIDLGDDVNFERDVKPQGRPKIIVTDEVRERRLMTRAERARERRRREREVKVAEGTYRGRGRPRRAV